MSESFGARLRHQRERQHIGLSVIAEQTKIKLSLLEGLERDDVSQWPSGIFRRAFVRTYARAIGLEPDAVVQTFLALYPDPSDGCAPVPAVPPEAESAAAANGPPTRLRYLVGSAIDSLGRRRRDAARPREAAGSEPPSTDRRPLPLVATAAFAPDLPTAARVCTELARVADLRGVEPLLADMAGSLGAAGLIVWLWHPHAGELRPALAHGYPERVLVQLPKLGRGAENATAAAFRSGQSCVVDGGTLAGALVAPLVTGFGCIGVLALELREGRERLDSVRAVATMFAAQLARVVGIPEQADADSRRLA